jgi:prepilin-type N-terminal cleavage/methylation domain-containing protein
MDHILMFKVNSKKNNSERGFTLVEMLVSVAIFSIVVMISLGAILTILEAKRKARTLTEVMNNLNFSIEMITRSLKTGVEPDYTATDGGTIIVGAIILDEEGFKREKTRYRLSNEDGRGFIERCATVINDSQSYAGADCASNDWMPITSDMVDIERFDVLVTATESFNDGVDQPRTQLFIKGTVQISDRISSDFSLQTTVSQRRLNLVGSELDINN